MVLVLRNLPANAGDIKRAIKGDIKKFYPWVRKIPWRRKWQPTTIFFSGEFHGQDSGGLPFIGLQRV